MNIGNSFQPRFKGSAYDFEAEPGYGFKCKKENGKDIKIGDTIVVRDYTDTQYPEVVIGRLRRVDRIETEYYKVPGNDDDPGLRWDKHLRFDICTAGDEYRSFSRKIYHIETPNREKQNKIADLRISTLDEIMDELDNNEKAAISNTNNEIEKTEISTENPTQNIEELKQQIDDYQIYYAQAKNTVKDYMKNPPRYSSWWW